MDSFASRVLGIGKKSTTVGSARNCHFGDVVVQRALLDPLVFPHRRITLDELDNNAAKTRGDVQLILPDFTYMDYVIEAFVSSACTSLFIPKTILPSPDHFGELRKVYGGGFIREFELDTGRRKAALFLKDVFEEGGCSASGSFLYTDGDDDRHLAFLNLYRSLSYFLAACDQRSQYRASIPALLKEIGNLRDFARSPKARHRLAILGSIFASYQAVEAPALSFNSSARHEQVEILQNLLREDAYLDLSRKIGHFQRGESVARTLADMARIVRHISSMKLFKGAFQYGAKLLSAATNVPSADIGQFAELANEGFPLAVDSSAVEQQAKKVWSEKSNSAAPLWYHTDAKMIRVTSIEDQEFTPIIVKIDSDAPEHLFKVARVIGFHGAGDSTELVFEV